VLAAIARQDAIVAAKTERLAEARICSSMNLVSDPIGVVGDDAPGTGAPRQLTVNTSCHVIQSVSS
jgi:hypothetical protein